MTPTADLMKLVEKHGISTSRKDGSLAPSVKQLVAFAEDYAALSAMGEARVGGEVDGLLNILDLLRTDRHGKKWDCIQSASGSMVDVSGCFTTPAQPKASEGKAGGEGEVDRGL